VVEKGPGYINFKNIRWRTPLHWACSYAGYEGTEGCEEIAYFLVKNGANFNADNRDGFSSLDYAKKGPLGKVFVDNLRKAGQGVAIRKVDIGLGPGDRVYWG
jgi:ankyrin repeat protein